MAATVATAAPAARKAERFAFSWACALSACAVWLAGCGALGTRVAGPDDHDPANTDDSALPARAQSSVAHVPAAPAAADGGTPSARESADAGANEPPLIVPQPIDDPSGHALDAFHAALVRTQSGGQARIVFYGASHVASDLYTDVIRAKLAARFGDAGTGFVLPSAPFPGYRNAGVELDKGIGWKGIRIKAKSPSAARYGLAGVYLTTRRGKSASAAFTTRAHAGLSGNASRFELYYARLPDGGTLHVRIDGVPHTLHTRSKQRRFETAYESFNVPLGPHRVELLADSDGPVQVFGVAIERGEQGVRLDTLGIPGSRAAYQLLWDDALYREHLARRNPDLIALAYGTNESGDDDQDMNDYEAQLLRVVKRMREVTPNASCLLIGPSDRPIKNDDGTFSHRPRTDWVIASQRRVAATTGCGFFDVAAFMGGPLAMLRWTSAIPPLATRDYVHFTRRGYEALGNVLFDDLMVGEPWPETHPGEPAEPPASPPDILTAPPPAPEISASSPGSLQSP